jgi:hypothetical protein
MPARRPLPSDRSIVVRAAMVPAEIVETAIALPVDPDWDADAFEAACFGAMIEDPHADPMFAGALEAGPLAQDGALDGIVGARLPAAFRSE